jgi:hypothetical protein
MAPCVHRLLAAAGVLAFAPGAPLLGQEADLAAQAAAVSRRLTLAEKQLELASGTDFYLVLDPVRSKLLFFLNGTVLRDFPFRGVEVGYPRVAFVSRRPDHEWQGRVFGNGQLDPPREMDRFVYDAPPPTKDGVEPPPRIPPTPEEMYPVPPRYHVRFEGGISIEVRAVDKDPELGFFSRLRARLGLWWHDAWAASTGDATDTVRLRLDLDPGMAASLYRALPPGTRLLVLPMTD